MPCCQPIPKQPTSPSMDGREKPATSAGRCHCGSNGEGADSAQRKQASLGRQCCDSNGNGRSQEQR